MKRKTIQRVLALILTVCLAAPFAVIPSDAAAPDLPPVVRVGLYHSSAALLTANLANEVGSGYSFGWYDDERSFHSVGYTAAEKITICPDRNLNYSAGQFTDDGPGTLIGAYHLQIGSYFSFEEASIAAQSYPYGFPAYVGGAYTVRFEFFSSPENAYALSAEYPGASIVGGSDTCFTVVSTDTGMILFEFDRGADGFAIEPNSPMEKAGTWFRGYLYCGGFAYTQPTAGKLTVVNYVPLEDYVAGVLPYELSASWPIEALKSGAVCMRSFVSATHKHRTFDVCNTTCCQVYRGVYRGTGASNIDAAVNATAGECAYYMGQPIEAVYSAGTGGYTESALNTWGADKGYLQATIDEYDATEDYPGCNWSYTVTSAQVTSMLRNAGKNCSNIVGMAVTKLTEAGNVLEVSFKDANGKIFTLDKDNVRLLGNISGVTYMSRCFVITPGSGTGPKTSSGQPISSGSGSTATTESYAIYDGSELTTGSTITVMTADGLQQISGSVTCITAGGTAMFGQSAKSVSGERSFANRVNPENGSADLSYATTWTITGSGNGHNVGLSQWGARNMANRGFTYRDILKYYFTNIEIY